MLFVCFQRHRLAAALLLSGCACIALLASRQEKPAVSLPGVTFVATGNRNLQRQQLQESQLESWRERRALRDAIRSSPPWRVIYGHECVTSEQCHAVPRSDMGGQSLGGVVVQSSTEPVRPATHSDLGLISAVLTAYNHHLDLALDPNDVWITILSQFSAYVNGGDRAEQLRDKIVDFKGKKTLVVRGGGTLFTADFGHMAVGMVDEIAGAIKDASLREWFLPGFSTTTTADQISASVAAMSTLQKYFDFRFELWCGIPKVTLLGTLDDWRLLRSKIERLAEFDLEDKLMAAWLKLLRPVADNFVLSFQGQVDVAFWDRVVSHIARGSGSRYISGWIAVFSVFDTEGNWQAHKKGQSNRGAGQMESSTRDDAEVPAWPVINAKDLNHNQLSVPVTIDDNGVEYNGTLFAGQFVFECAEDTVKPRSDWAIAVAGSGQAVAVTEG